MKWKQHVFIFLSQLTKNDNAKVLKVFTYWKKCYIFQVKTCIVNATNDNPPLRMLFRDCNKEQPLTNANKCYKKIPEFQKCFSPVPDTF